MYVWNWYASEPFVQLRCANCGEETKWVYVTQIVSVAACGSALFIGFGVVCTGESAGQRRKRSSQSSCQV